MPAGCDFVCNNEECSNYESGFTMTSPWPMGSIYCVLESSSVKRKDDLKDHLIQLKQDGRKYACIPFPNLDNIEHIATRVQLWSPDANCLWEYDVMNPELDIQEAIKLAQDIPDKCPKTGGELLEFTKIIGSEVKCPMCGQKLSTNRWFANEE